MNGFDVVVADVDFLGAIKIKMVMVFPLLSSKVNDPRLNV